MTTASGAGEAFSSVFSNDDRDSGADSAAPAARETPSEARDEFARDERGRFATPQTEPDAPAAPAAVDTAPPVAAESTPKTPADSRMVPLSELLSEREKRRAKEEAFLRADAQREIYERQLQQLQRTQPQAPEAQQPQQQNQGIPDPIIDPQGFIEYQTNAIKFQMANQNADVSEYRAVQKYGAEAVEAAKAAAVQAGLGMKFLYRPDPYEDVMAWHKRANFIQKVGPDPDAYEKSIREKVRNEVLVELKQGGPKPTFPTSLADATPTGDQGGHISMKAVASSVFAPEGRSRR